MEIDRELRLFCGVPKSICGGREVMNCTLLQLLPKSRRAQKGRAKILGCPLYKRIASYEATMFHRRRIPHGHAEPSAVG
jgi:hypothetical protein